MDEATQQLLALGLVALAVAFDLWRRWRKRNTQGKAGCDGCEKSTGESNKDTAEKPLRLYRRR